jgi:hypothetical protein
VNAILRHYALRLFATAFLGTLLCLVLLPRLQWLMGGSWVTLPVASVLVGCFFLLGWLMNRLGLSLIHRQVTESAVWERAGMAAEAEGAFERIKSLFDSFWLSAAARQQHAAWVTMRLARFYLTQARPDQEGLAMVMSHLRLHPGDEAVAKGWLEAMLHRETATAEEQETAARISEVLVDHDAVQRLLMQFFLTHRRVDFEAMQTYRRIWHCPGELPSPMIRTLARVLLSEAFIDDWALQVYLKAYGLGETDCLEGIAAGLQFLRPHVDNGSDLAMAREIIAQLDESRQRELIRKFSPPREDAAKSTEKVGSKPLAAAGRGLVALGLSLKTALKNGLRWSCDTARPIPRNALVLWRQSPKLRRAAPAVTMVTVLGIMIASGWQGTKTAPSSIPAPAPATARKPISAPLPTPVADPFTIQVAAYLKAEDAQRFVDQLKRNQIEAFSSKAVSANRTWYQVKVSHFATKGEAVKYGEMIKAKGLIDDFYVANYSNN